MAKKKQETPQADSVMEDAATVEIAGQEYTLRKLGFRDTWRVGRIFSSSLHVLADESGAYSPNQVAAVFVGSVLRAEDDALKLIASVLQISEGPKAFDDTDRFPMEDIVDVVEAIGKSNQIKSFFAKCNNLMGALPEMQTASREHSAS